MPRGKTVSAIGKTVVIRMRKTHRVLILATFTLLIIAMLTAMIHIISLSDFGLEINILLLAIATIPFLPLPLYYTTWQITLDAEGIQKRLFWINQTRHSWAQVEEVRSAWLISERNYGISIKLKGRKTIRFRTDCENAEQAKKLILSHCSIDEHGTPYA